MDNEDNLDKSGVHAEDNSIARGAISVGGNTGDVHIGHTQMNTFQSQSSNLQLGGAISN